MSQLFLQLNKRRPESAFLRQRASPLTHSKQSLWRGPSSLTPVWIIYWMTDDCKAAGRMTNTFCWLRVSSRSGSVLWSEVSRGAQTDLALLILLTYWVLELLMGAAALGSPQSQERWLKTCSYLRLFCLFEKLTLCVWGGGGGDRAWHKVWGGNKMRGSEERKWKGEII